MSVRARNRNGNKILKFMVDISRQVYYYII